MRRPSISTLDCHSPTPAYRSLRVAAVVALALAACSSLVEPTIGDVYVLRSADGSGLPIQRATEGGVLITVTGDTIRVLDDGRYERTSVVAVTNSAGAGSSGHAQSTIPTEVGVLVRTADRFILEAICPDGSFILCVAPDTIAFSKSGAVIRGSYLLGGAIRQADGALRYDQR